MAWKLRISILLLATHTQTCENLFGPVLIFLSLFYYQSALSNDAVISVNRCVWAPDGLMLGMLGYIFFSKLKYYLISVSSSSLKMLLSVLELNIGFYRCCIFKAYSPDISVQSNGRIKTAFGGKPITTYIKYLLKIKTKKVINNLLYFVDWCPCWRC